MKRISMLILACLLCLSTPAVSAEEAQIGVTAWEYSGPNLSIANSDVSIAGVSGYMRNLVYPLGTSNTFMEVPTGGGEAYAIRYGVSGVQRLLGYQYGGYSHGAWNLVDPLRMQAVDTDDNLRITLTTTLPIAGKYVTKHYLVENTSGTVLTSVKFYQYVEPNANSDNTETTTYDASRNLIYSTNNQGFQKYLGVFSNDLEDNHDIGAFWPLDATGVLGRIQRDSLNSASGPYTGDSGFAFQGNLGDLAPGEQRELSVVFVAGDSLGEIQSLVDNLSASVQRVYGIPVEFRFAANLVKGAPGPQVRYLQITLNMDSDTRVASTGDGSPGNETTSFGTATESAVKRFQMKHGIISSEDAPGAGQVGPQTRAKLNEILDAKFTVAYKQRFSLLDRQERKSTIWDYIKAFKSTTEFSNTCLPADFPAEITLAVAVQETGDYAQWNNEHVANDWGRGIMQVTWDAFVGAGGVDSTSEDCIKAKNRDSRIYASKYYSNTLRGIEANIKDGLCALVESYRLVGKDSVPSDGITIDDTTWTKDEIIWMSTMQRYNPLEADRLDLIGDKLISLAAGAYGYFPGFDNEHAKTLGEKFKSAYSESLTLFSPALLRVYDGEGNVTGFVDGEIREDIPNSICADEIKTIVILFPSDGNYYDVEGISEGTYGLTASLCGQGECTSLTATSIPIALGALHRYQIDWDILACGEEGVTVSVDADGDGIFESTFTTSIELTGDQFILHTETFIDVNPDVLNLKARGGLVTVYIELPAGFDVHDIDISTILLNGTVPALSRPVSVGDYNSNGIQDLMVKFDRRAVQAILEVGQSGEMTITGEVGGIPFMGTDTIRVIDPTWYSLEISSTAGGSVTVPGEGTFSYKGGTVVSLVATPVSDCYRFAYWTGDVGTIADVTAPSTTITMYGDCSIIANFEEQAVAFPDPNLEAAIREAIGKPTGNIYPSDLAGLTELHANGRDVSDLTGLEHCTGLTDLTVGHNQISDISPLAGLTSLTELYLGSNQISDVSPLAGLTSLTGLDLWHNQISDISPLAGLTTLRYLNLGSNQISDVSPLAGFTGLTWLYLVNNQIGDISPLAGLTSLTWLNLGSNQMSDISPLASLTSLTTLYLYINQISDISPLAGLTNLTSLGLSDNQISDISALVDNDGLGEGDTVVLTDNPLSEQSLNEYIPILQARGVIVYY